MNRNGTEALSTAHERARQLILAHRVEGISDRDREWLDGHLEGCARCAEEAAVVGALIESLRAAPPLASAEMVQRARLAVRRRSADLGVQRARAVPLLIAVAFSAASMVLTTPFTWRAFASLAEAVRLPDVMWQVGFLMWWFLPATVLAAIVAWRQAGAGPSEARWTTQTNWGQS